jgi:hypothetical protein
MLTPRVYVDFSACEEPFDEKSITNTLTGVLEIYSDNIIQEVSKNFAASGSSE